MELTTRVLVSKKRYSLPESNNNYFIGYKFVRMKYKMLTCLFLITLLAPALAKGIVFNLIMVKAATADQYLTVPGRGLSKNTNTGNFIISHKHRPSTFADRIFQHFFKSKFKRFQSKEKKRRSRGILPLILSIAGIVFVFIPVLMPVAFISLLAAVIIGKKLKRKYPGDKTTESAVALGWLGLVLLAGALLLSLLGSFQYLKFG